MISTHVDAAGIAEVVVDHPPVNALPVAGWYELARRGHVRRVATAACAWSCCAPRDAASTPGSISRRSRRGGFEALIGANRGCFAAFAAVYECAVPVIAAVHGFCLGGGIGLAGNADIIVASEDATFGLPEVDRGALGAATHLSRLVPQHKARAMMYTSATATAAELHAFGSVYAVVPRDQLRAAALELAAEIAAKDPAVIRMAKEAFNGIDLRDVRRSYRYEQGFTFELNLSGVSDRLRESLRPHRTALRRNNGRTELMDLTWSPSEEAFRGEARAWLDANVPGAALPSGDTREGFAAHLEWERTLFDGPLGGRVLARAVRRPRCDPVGMADLRGGVLPAGAPQRVTQNGIFLLAPTVFEFGTPEQQDRILPRMAAAQDLWCQGWSEPGAGQRPGGHPQPRGPRRRSAAAGGCPGRRPGRPAARSARTCSACSAPTPRPSGTGG